MDHQIKSTFSPVLSKEYAFRAILIGQSQVGKTSLLVRYTENTFHMNGIDTKSTVGVDFKIKNIEVDSAAVRLQIWDTAGQERFRHINRAYFREVQGAIIVFDLTDRTTFESLPSWIEDLTTHGPGNENRILIGNKEDLAVGEARQVQYIEAKAFANDYNMPYIECSARTGHNVSQALATLSQNMIFSHKSNPKVLDKTGKSTLDLVLTEEKDIRKKRKCNC